MHGYKNKIYDITLRFVDGFYLTIPPENVFIHEIKDFSLILVDKKDVPIETLNLLKYVNGSSIPHIYFKANSMKELKNELKKGRNNRIIKKQ